MCYAIYFCIFATIFFLIGRYKYNNPKKYKAFSTMKDILDENKMHLFEVREKNDESERVKTKRIIEAIEEIKHEKLSKSVMEINGSMVNTEIVVGEKDIN